MQNNSHVYILFHTIHDVLRAEKILKQHGLDHELVPVPRNLSSDCGMCVRLSTNVDRALAAFEGLDIAGCHDAEGRPLATHKI